MNTSETIDIEKLNQYLRQSPFNAWLGCRIVRFDPDTGHMELELPLRAEIARHAESEAHGGVVAALIDIAAHACLHAMTGFGMPTIDLKVDYLMPGEMPLIARAKPRRVGRTLGFVDVEVIDARGRTSAIGRAILLTRTPAGNVSS